LTFQLTIQQNHNNSALAAQISRAVSDQLS